MDNNCKICGSSRLSIYQHTATCLSCGVLLYYPYPKSDTDLLTSGEGKPFSQIDTLEWYTKSSFFNHHNFTQMIRFAMDESYKNKNLSILDYGGGGGQFSLVFRSLYPEASVFITDICDAALLDQWRDCNIQIPYNSFATDETKFDFIFLNDVFEHLSDPSQILQLLAKKLKENGKIFIDTPRQFWIYPVTKIFSKNIYKKVLKGTVSFAHLQIWSKSSFEIVVRDSGLKCIKYSECSEYTMPPEFYMNNMGISSSIIRSIGKLFYRFAKYIAKNKIICVLSKNNGM